MTQDYDFKERQKGRAYYGTESFPYFCDDFNDCIGCNTPAEDRAINIGLIAVGLFIVGGLAYAIIRGPQEPTTPNNARDQGRVTIEQKVDK